MYADTWREWVCSFECEMWKTPQTTKGNPQKTRQVEINQLDSTSEKKISLSNFRFVWAPIKPMVCAFATENCTKLFRSTGEKTRRRSSKWPRQDIRPSSSFSRDNVALNRFRCYWTVSSFRNATSTASIVLAVSRWQRENHCPFMCQTAFTSIVALGLSILLHFTIFGRKCFNKLINICIIRRWLS